MSLGICPHPPSLGLWKLTHIRTVKHFFFSFNAFCLYTYVYICMRYPLTFFESRFLFLFLWSINESLKYIMLIIFINFSCFSIFFKIRWLFYYTYGVLCFLNFAVLLLSCLLDRILYVVVYYEWKLNFISFWWCNSFDLPLEPFFFIP